MAMAADDGMAWRDAERAYHQARVARVALKMHLEDEARLQEVNAIQLPQIDMRLDDQGPLIEQRMALSLRRENLSQRRYISARAFVMEAYLVRASIRTFGRQYPAFEEVATQAIDMLDAVIPGLKAVRDAFAHQDERGMALGKDKKGRVTKIQAKGFADEDGHAEPTGIFFTGLLGADFYVHDAEGVRQAIRIDQDTVDILQAAASAVMEAASIHRPAFPRGPDFADYEA